MPIIIPELAHFIVPIWHVMLPNFKIGLMGNKKMGLEYKSVNTGTVGTRGTMESKLSEGNYILSEGNYELSERKTILSEGNYELSEGNYELSEENYELSERNYKLSEENY